MTNQPAMQNSFNMPASDCNICSDCNEMFAVLPKEVDTATLMAEFNSVNATAETQARIRKFL